MSPIETCQSRVRDLETLLIEAPSLNVERQSTEHTPRSRLLRLCSPCTPAAQSAPMHILWKKIM